MTYPYVETKDVWSRAVRCWMANSTSESWYGLKGQTDIGRTEKEARDFWENFNSPLRSLIRLGDVVLDAGAHQGFLSCVFGNAVGPLGQVIGVEPVAANAEMARRNVILNRMAGWVHIDHAALGVRPGAFLTMSSERVHDHGEQVETRTLDSYIDLIQEGYGPVIKVDVEGYEVQVLRGAEALLDMPGVRIEAEIHLFGKDAPDMRHYGDTPGDLFDLLKRHGLSVFLPGDGFNHEKPSWKRLPNLDSVKIGCVYAMRSNES